MYDVHSLAAQHGGDPAEWAQALDRLHNGTDGQMVAVPRGVDLYVFCGAVCDATPVNPCESAPNTDCNEE